MALLREVAQKKLQIMNKKPERKELILLVLN